MTETVGDLLAVRLWDAPDDESITADLSADERRVSEAMQRAGDLYRYVGAKAHEHRAIPN